MAAIFLLLLAVALHFLSKRPHQNGTLFRIFIAAYLFWRLAIDFLKPQPLVHGLNLIQWACIAGLIVVALGALERQPENEVQHA